MMRSLWNLNSLLQFWGQGLYLLIQYCSKVSWQSLETWYSRLDSRSLILENFEDRGSSRVLRHSRPFKNLLRPSENLSSGKNKGLFALLTFDMSECYGRHILALPADLFWVQVHDISRRICLSENSSCRKCTTRVNKGSRASIVLFVAIVLFSRIKSFPWNLCLRSSKNSSSVSKLNPWNLILDPRKSKLEPRNSIFYSRKLRGSRIEFRVKTVNLPLCSTVHVCGMVLYRTSSTFGCPSEIMTPYMVQF